jgi:hypothetical protein
VEGELFQREAKRFIDMLVAAVSTGRCMAYDGVINGKDVIVLGYRDERGDGKLHAKPLAVCMTDEVFDMLEVNADKVRDDEQ